MHAGMLECGLTCRDCCLDGDMKMSIVETSQSAVGGYSLELPGMLEWEWL